MASKFFSTHRKTKIALIAVGSVVLVLVLFLALVDWNLLRPTVARIITARTGRPAAINGDLKVHLFSWTPRAEVNGLTLKNPSWAKQELMLSVTQISLRVNLARLLRGQLVIPELIILGPSVDLERDAQSRASWELGTAEGKPNKDTKPSKLPTIQRLIIQDGKLQVIDEIRKLEFKGTIAASDRKGPTALEFKASGSLNKKPFTLEASGAELLDLTPDQPYSFSASITASDIHLKSAVTIQKPFDFGKLDVKFDVGGKDLADIYYLTGLALPNTPAYQLGGTVHVSGTRYQLDDLRGTLGGSDMSGKVEVVNEPPRPKLTAILSSNKLNIADLAPTLGTAPPSGTLASQAPDKPKTKADKAQAKADAQAADYLLPDADLQVNRVRGMDADVTYKAGSVIAPKVPMREVAFRLKLNDGLLILDPLAFVLDEGKFAGSVKIDVRGATQVSDIDMRVQGVDLAQFKSKSMTEAPLTGTLEGRLKVHGLGSSVHKFAANAEGGFSVVIPHGEMNSAFAELTGINVTQGLGLLFTKKEERTEIRCSVMDFQILNGTMGAKTFFIDTSNILVNGKGNIDLKSEKIDLEIKGDPKKVRLTRIRSPVTVGGTLEHPSIGVDVKKLAGQGAVASALGVLLTPAAAVLAFIDPGLAKNKDCATSVNAEDKSVKIH